MGTVAPIATLQASVNNNSSVIVPAGVRQNHLGIAVFVSANIYSTGSIPAIYGWRSLASNPAIAGNMEWTVLTRNGGQQEGDQLLITQNLSTQFDLYLIWYDTAGRDIATVSVPAGRGSTSSTSLLVNGLYNVLSGQDMLLIATERSTSSGTAILAFGGNYAVTSDNFVESGTTVYSSNEFAHFNVPADAADTDGIAVRYNQASANAAGLLLALPVPNPTPPPVLPTTPLWSYWDGTKEIALPPAAGWDYTLSTSTIIHNPIVSITLMASPGVFVGADNNPYPATDIYPDGDYPSADNYPGEQQPSSTDYPSSTNYPGAQSYPDFGNIYPGG